MLLILAAFHIFNQMSTSDNFREQLVQSALTWLGTPYHDQARVKGIGVDCAQLVAAVAIDAGLVKAEDVPQDYNPQWHFHNHEELMLKYIEDLGCSQVKEARRGDILCFKFGRVNSHLGIYLGDNQFIHARKDTKSVCINSLSGDWAKRHLLTYSYPKEIR